MSAVRLVELTPKEVDAHLAEVPAVIVPIGTVEWHSHHLPLGLDGLKAEAIAELAADASRALLAPTQWCAADGVDFPYTLRLPRELVQPLLAALLEGFVDMGFHAVLVVNGHYGLANTRTVRGAAAACMRTHDHAVVVPVSDFDLLLRDGDLGDHAGLFETSLLWAARPALVHTDKLGASTDLPGVLGADPRDGAASEERGREALAVAGRRAGRLVERALTADPGDRADLLAALDAGEDVLAQIAEARAGLPRDQAPPLLTDMWRRHVDALVDGRFADAAQHARARAADITA